MIHKPFYLTSEFWVTVATVATALSGALPVGSREAVLIAGLAAAAYTISRGLSKAGAERPVPPPDLGDAGEAAAGTATEKKATP